MVWGCGASLGLRANRGERGGGVQAMRLGLGVRAGIAMALLLPLHALLAAAAGGLLLGAAYGLEWGDSVPKRVGVWLAYALALVGGIYTTDTLFSVGFLESFDAPFIGDLMRGGIWSVFLMLPAGLKYLEWETDPVLAEIREAKAVIKGRQREQLEAAEDAYERVLVELGREAQQDVRERAHEIAKEVCRGFIGLTQRAHELERTVAKTSARPLDQRVAELEGRIRSARDAVLRKELMGALAEVVEQVRTRRKLEVVVVRLDARQQRYLTALDRLHVTLVQNDSMTTSDDGSLNVSLDELSKLTEEVRWQNLSIEELVGDEDSGSAEGPAAELSEDEASMLEELLGQARGDLAVSSELPRVTLPTSSKDEDVVLSTPDGTDGEVGEEVEEESSQTVASS